MQKLPPYDENAVCPHCGGAEIEKRFSAGIGGGQQQCRYGACDDPVGRDEPHFHRRCDGCGYEWVEATLAAKEQL